MKPEVVTRRIEAFHQRFGEAHLDFAYHAAFPLALTPDLLYRLWANFQRDIHGEALKIPWLAVADLLLSSLCDEVGYELYEMETEVRNALLRELKANPRFGEKRIHELSDFLLVYVKQQLESHDPDMRDFAQVQTWTALAYTKPGEAAREIASALAKLKLEEKAEWVRMASIVETFAEPLAGFAPLMTYTRGMASFVRGKTTKAVTELSQLAKAGNKLEVSGLNLSIPESLIRQIEENSQSTQPSGKQRTYVSSPRVVNLEQPEGQVPLESAFYVERPPIEAHCYEEILKPGALIRIKSPHQMGKSSLMMQILHHSRQQGCQTASLNFQSIDGEVFSSQDRFLRLFCSVVTDQLNLPDKLEEFWNDKFSSSNYKCTNYFQRYLLSEINTPIVLGLDEVDVVFKYPEINSTFFGLLRAWHESAKNDPVCKKLRLLVVHSYEIYFSGVNESQSPFNVGLVIELPELNQAQVQELVKRHGLHWTQEQVKQLMTLVGGHPYLVRVALYQIARERMTLETLLQIAPTDEGPYSDHLRRHLLNLQENVQLLAAFRKVILATNPLEIGTTQAFKLRSMGLVKFQGNKVVPLCELYRQYFGDRLGFDSVPEEVAQVQSPLIQQILTLQGQYDLLSEKLKRLRIDLVIEAGTAVKFQLQKHIEETQAETERLFQQIEKLENKLQ